MISTPGRGVGGPLPPDGISDVTDRAAGIRRRLRSSGFELGGAVIARRLLEHGRATPDQTTYLRLYGDALGRVWQRFTERLHDACGASFGPLERRAAAIEAAQRPSRRSIAR